MTKQKPKERRKCSYKCSSDEKLEEPFKTTYFEQSRQHINMQVEIALIDCNASYFIETKRYKRSWFLQQ
jgi:hypothetical protein